jgi:hypothetical protein
MAMKRKKMALANQIDKKRMIWEIIVAIRMAWLIFQYIKIQINQTAMLKRVFSQKNFFYIKKQIFMFDNCMV